MNAARLAVIAGLLTVIVSVMSFAGSAGKPFSLDKGAVFASCAGWYKKAFRLGKGE